MVISRRTFIVDSALMAFVGLRKLSAESSGKKTTLRIEFKIRTLTSGPKHHFFGYYEICPWNKSGRYIVCLESIFQDRMPSRGEAAGIGLVDLETGEFSKVAETRAWNLQQGAMLHWNPLNPENEIIYNDLQGNDIASVILNVKSENKRILPRAVSAVSHNGK
jgi:hypothetical protein